MMVGELIDALYEDAKKTKTCGSPTRRTVELMRMAAAEINNLEEDSQRQKHENANLMRENASLRDKIAEVEDRNEKLCRVARITAAELASISQAIDMARKKVINLCDCSDDAANHAKEKEA
jgi:predicted RNase H-like nuclease (RuvC/YqgF family)